VVALGDRAARLAGTVVEPADAGFDEARLSWNLSVEQHPVGVVYPQSSKDMAEVVRFAAAAGLRVAFNSGGHNAAGIDWSPPALLVKTERMSAIEIDPQRRRARIEAGVLAKPLADAAGAHGLAFLAGTSPDAGLSGYLLGGGLSWMVRRHGLACNHVHAIEVVTADGRVVRADAETEPDLFWALRGGGGNFGAVTAFEIALFEEREIYAGCLFWSISRAGEVLRAWREWAETAPVECHSIGRMLQLPDLPFLPEHLRGRSFVLVEPAFIGAEADGAELVAPLRALEPEFDTVAMTAMSELSTVNMDPELPLPYAGDGMLLVDVDEQTIDTLTAAFVGSPLVHVELRHLGGALRERSPSHGALDGVDAGFLAFTFGLTPEAESKLIIGEAIEGLLGALAPWDSGKRYLNLTESRVDARMLFGEDCLERLRAVRRRYDPHGVFAANHVVPLA
jgi:FAD/FMN-containing dehydrogenase